MSNMDEKLTMEESAEMAVETAAEPDEEVIEREYTLRDLKDSDMWAIIDIITKVLPDNMAKIAVSVMTKEKKLEDVGAGAVYQIVVSILKNINLIQEELYDFLSDVSGIAPEDIKNMKFGTTPMMIWDIVGNAKGASFFKVVSKLL